VDRFAPRTLLEQLIGHSDRTIEEHCQDFDACARRLGERATLSPRQLGRWMAGEIRTARPSARRVARRLWGHDFAALTQPPPETTAVVPVHVDGRDRSEHRNETPPLDATLQEEFDMATEESARFARYAGTELTSTALEQIDADIRQLAVEYLHRPPYVLFQSEAALRREVFAIIDRHPRPEHLPDLYRFAAMLSALLALSSRDLAQHYAAESHARTAYLCADMAGDAALRALVRWFQSSIAFWRGDYRAAAEFAIDGQRHDTTGRHRLPLLIHEARDQAAAGRFDEADDALTRAADAREHHPDTPAEPGTFHYRLGEAEYMASEVRLDIGGTENYRQAVLHAEEARRLFEAAPDTDQGIRFPCYARLDQAAAHLALGDLDAAHAQLQPVLTLPAEHRTVPIMGLLDKITTALADPRYATARTATELREQIDVFGAYPAARNLPELST